MSERWREVRVGGVRFDLMGVPPRLIRIRNRDQDNGRENAYAVIDLWTRKQVDTEYAPRRRPGEKKGK